MRVVTGQIVPGSEDSQQKDHDEASSSSTSRPLDPSSSQTETWPSGSMPSFSVSPYSPSYTRVGQPVVPARKTPGQRLQEKWRINTRKTKKFRRIPGVGTIVGASSTIPDGVVLTSSVPPASRADALSSHSPTPPAAGMSDSSADETGMEEPGCSRKGSTCSEAEEKRRRRVSVVPALDGPLMEDVEEGEPAAEGQVVVTSTTNVFAHLLALEKTVYPLVLKSDLQPYIFLGIFFSSLFTRTNPLIETLVKFSYRSF